MVSLQKHNSKKFLNYWIHVLKENNLTMKVLVPQYSCTRNCLFKEAWQSIFIKNLSVAYRHT